MEQFVRSMGGEGLSEQSLILLEDLLDFGQGGALQLKEEVVV